MLPKTNFSGVLVQLLKKNKNDAVKAYEEFNNETQKRFLAGATPNDMYSTTMTALSKLVPLQGDLNKLQAIKSEIGNNTIDGIIHDYHVTMNETIGDEVYELPDLPPITVKQEIHRYRQLLIEIENKIPQVKGDKHGDLMWGIDIIRQKLEGLMGKG